MRIFNKKVRFKASKRDRSIVILPNINIFGKMYASDWRNWGVQIEWLFWMAGFTVEDK